MKKTAVVATLAVALCSAIMAVNPNPVLADDALEQEIFQRVKKIKHMLMREVLPRLGSVPKTGQTTCYDADGGVIDCAGTGQDGEYRKGTPWPNPRFTDNGDGTVTDRMTRLIWLKNANCMATNYPGFDNDLISGDGKVSWQHALDFVAGINDGTYSDCSAGYNDWRLPNPRELGSLVDFENIDPALPSGHPFVNVQDSDTWTSTTHKYDTSIAWRISMDTGRLAGQGKTTHDGYVWPVRGAQ